MSIISLINYIYIYIYIYAHTHARWQSKYFRHDALDKGIRIIIIIYIICTEIYALFHGHQYVGDISMSVISVW